MTYFSTEILKDLRRRDAETSAEESMEIHDVGIIESIFNPKNGDDHKNQGVAKRSESRTPKVAAASSSKGKYILTL